MTAASTSQRIQELCADQLVHATHAREELIADLTSELEQTAWDRNPEDDCQRGTPGCSVDHRPGTKWSCATW